MNSKSPVAYLLLAVLWFVVAVVQYAKYHMIATLYVYGFAVLAFLAIAIYYYRKNKKVDADR